MRKPTRSTEGFEAAAKSPSSARYVLHLYVAGTTPRSVRAVEAVRALCDLHLAGRFELSVVDVYQQPELARDADIVAVPTLVRSQPTPVRRILGDMTDLARVLASLDIVPESHEKARARKTKTPKR